jgi:cold shock protein
MREKHGPVHGQVRLWNGEEGWGVLVPDDTSLEVWVHFSQVDLPGYVELSAGQRVRFEYETPGQDGYLSRAVHGVTCLQ